MSLGAMSHPKILPALDDHQVALVPSIGTAGANALFRLLKDLASVLS